ncbi:MAG: glutamine amidotransferase [Hyphomonadaceae bacterium]
MKTALALRHSAHVGLDLVGEWLRARGYAIRTIDAPKEDLPAARDAIVGADALILLGGEMGVYETEKYPWLKEEFALVRERIDARGPTLGLCLGAQVMAASLGARVYPGAAGQEIGWVDIDFIGESVLSPLVGKKLMQWHGDTFDLPEGATRLARNATYENQAFEAGAHALGLQFHLELSAEGLETWLRPDRDHPQLLRLGLTNADLRAQAAAAVPAMKEPAFAALDNWRAKSGA